MEYILGELDKVVNVEVFTTKCEAMDYFKERYLDELYSELIDKRMRLKASIYLENKNILKDLIDSGSIKMFRQNKDYFKSLNISNNELIFYSVAILKWGTKYRVIQVSLYYNETVTNVLRSDYVNNNTIYREMSTDKKELRKRIIKERMCLLREFKKQVLENDKNIKSISLRGTQIYYSM